MSSKSKTEKRKSSKDENNCIFCFETNSDSLNLGKLIKFNDLFVHYYCLLLSSGLSQNGSDGDGIYGFLIDDIRKEEKRGKKLKCSYCRRSGATIGCVIKTASVGNYRPLPCKTSFHLSCGLKNQTMHQFFNNFDSYCVKHRPKQTLDVNQELNDSCPTCYVDLEFDEGIDVLVTPCCQKLVHRLCLARQALSSAYYFKCPLCNNSREFKETMTQFGIYVPKQDASWEQNNAFGELYERHSRCDQNPCVCPDGRQYSGSAKWQLLLCDTCGSNGSHYACVGRSDWFDVWVCDDCNSIVERVSKRLKKSDVNGSDGLESDVEVLYTDPNTSFHSGNRNVGVRHSLRKSSIRLSTNSNQMFEINVLEELAPKRTKSKPIAQKKVLTKDVEIQCNLVDAEDLIDCDPIDDYDNYHMKGSIINVKNYSNQTEVIDVDDSSDDDCVLID